MLFGARRFFAEDADVVDTSLRDGAAAAETETDVGTGPEFADWRIVTKGTGVGAEGEISSVVSFSEAGGCAIGIDAAAEAEGSTKG